MHASIHNMQKARRPKVWRPKKQPRDFAGAANAAKIDARSRAYAARLEAWLSAKARKMVRDEITRLKAGGVSKILKATPKYSDEQILTILSSFGFRQLNDSGREIAGDEWAMTPSYESRYLREKEIQIQFINQDLEKEFNESVSRALGAWMRESPQPTINQISQRLRTWLTVPSDKPTPRELQPLGNRFTPGGLGARARMIARTELNDARNDSKIEAGRALGFTYKMWMSYSDGRSGDRHHEALNRKVIPMDEWFVNPKTGARLRRPGDPQAKSPFGVLGEIINCRCSVRPISTARAERMLRGR